MGQVVLPYNLRTHNEFSSRVPKTFKHGAETIFFSSKRTIKERFIKERSCLEGFKSKIRKWKPYCSCRLCKTYLRHVGFL